MWKHPSRSLLLWKLVLTAPLLADNTWTRETQACATWSKHPEQPRIGKLQLKCDGTRWREVGEVKEKLANGVGSQYPSHYLGTWCLQHYYRWCAHLGCQQSTELTPPADLNGLVHFAERRNLVSASVPSHFNCHNAVNKVQQRVLITFPLIYVIIKEGCIRNI